MSVEALILFGSHARGDAHPGSDIDIIAVIDGPQHSPFEKESLSICFYSRRFLFKIAELGNLFALHVIKEGKVIYDPNNVLSEMRSVFMYKENYNKEVSDASMLAWFLLRHKDKVEDWKLFNKRAAWCVRTILIARAVQQREVLFSAAALDRFFRDEDANFIINNRNSSQISSKAVVSMTRFLSKFGLGDPKIYDVDDIDKHIEYIIRSENIVGRRTIKNLFDQSWISYEGG